MGSKRALILQFGHLRGETRMSKQYVVATQYRPDGLRTEKVFEYESREKALKHADLLKRQGWRFSVTRNFFAEAG